MAGNTIIGPSYGSMAPFTLPFPLEILSTRAGAPLFPVATGVLNANTGQPVSCSRAAPAYCLGNDGLIHLLGANTIRVEPNGLLVEGASTNYVLWCRDLTNAAWTKTNMTAAKTAVGYDGGAASATTLTATSANGTVAQTVVAPGPTAWCGSFAIKRRSGAGAVLISADGGVTSINVTSLLSANQWAVLASNPTSTASPTLWLQMAVSGDSVDVDFAQLETGFTGVVAGGASSRILTTTTTATRDNDLVTVTNPFNGTTLSTWTLGATGKPSVGSWVNSFKMTGVGETFFVTFIGDAVPNCIVTGTKDGIENNLYVQDNSVNFKRHVLGNALVGGLKTVLTWHDAAGTLTSSPGSSPVDTGTGTGIPNPQGTPIYLGSNGTYGGFIWLTDIYFTNS